jgi:hypothetical protein
VRLHVCIEGTDIECAETLAALAAWFVVYRVSAFVPASGAVAGRVWATAKSTWPDRMPADTLLTPLDLDVLNVPAGGRS